jgi:hypothetical protein
MPRHPPFALRNLTTKIKIAIDSSTRPPRKVIIIASDLKDARVHCVVLNIRSAPHSPEANAPASCSPPKDTHRSHNPCGPTPTTHTHHGHDQQEAWSLRTQQRAPASSSTPTRSNQTKPGVLKIGSITPNCTVNVPPMSYRQPRSGYSAPGSHHHPYGQPQNQMLLRKEVIQPHLPVRLPCYDLVLITDPTFDGSFHKG